VVNARSELTRAVSLMSIKLRMVLTAAQWQELQRRETRRSGSPAMRGPGMSGRPPRPSGVQRPPNQEF